MRNANVELRLRQVGIESDDISRLNMLASMGIFPPQVGMLYKAQHIVFPAEHERRDFQSSTAMLNYAESVRLSQYVAHHWPGAVTKPVPKYRFDFGRLSGNQLGATDPFEREVIIPIPSIPILLHELAHLIDADNYSPESTFENLQDNAGHGPRFAGIFIALVEEFIGKAEAKRLRENFDKYGVRYLTVGG